MNKEKAFLMALNPKRTDMLQHATQVVITNEALAIARQAVAALKLADTYLDGFVWIDEPEMSELASIKAASSTAQRRLARLETTA